MTSFIYILSLKFSLIFVFSNITFIGLWKQMWLWVNRKTFAWLHKICAQLLLVKNPKKVVETFYRTVFHLHSNIPSLFMAKKLTERDEIRSMFRIKILTISRYKSICFGGWMIKSISFVQKQLDFDVFSLNLCI